ncbi:hypothetical protein [Candidatus Avelusimicrobium sp.]
MKKYISFLIVSLCCILVGVGAFAASPWGMMDEYNRPQTKLKPMDKILTGDTIRYLILNEDIAPEDQPQYMSLIVQAINAWPNYVADQIRISGRDMEFMDILPLLSKGVRTEMTQVHKKADVQVNFVSQQEITDNCGHDAGGCIMFDSLIYVPKIVTYNNNYSNYKSVLSTLIHEVGHSFGLADQYYSGANQNASARHSTSDRINSDKSIMSYENDLGCDDVDGFINVMDIMSAKLEGAYSERAQKGWKSFCDATMYKNGKVLNRKPYMIGNRRHEYDAQGNLKSTQYKMPFFYYDSPIKTITDDRYSMAVNMGREYWTLSVYDQGINFSNGNYELSTTRTADQKGVSWEFPFLKKMSTISLKPNGCTAELSMDSEVSVTALMDENENLKKVDTMYLKSEKNSKSYFIDTPLTYSASFIVGNHIITPPFKDTGTCEVRYWGYEVMKMQGDTILSTNEEGIQEAMKATNLSYDSVINDSVKICKKLQEKSDLHLRYAMETTHYCKFFKRLEEYF